MGMENTPENRLALRLTVSWLDAISCDNFLWMEEFVKEMTYQQDLEPLARLEQLCGWVKTHPPKRFEKNQ
jgi:hypothetical protein